MTKLFLIAALLGLAGCQGMGNGGGYNPNYVPLPTGDQLRAQQPQPYMMPIQRQTVCNTQRIGNQLQTVCQ